jgi:hypothetical protein
MKRGVRKQKRTRGWDGVRRSERRQVAKMRALSLRCNLLVPRTTN